MKTVTRSQLRACYSLLVILIMIASVLVISPYASAAGYPIILSSSGGFVNADSGHTFVALPSGIVANDMLIVLYELKITAFAGAITLTGNGTWTVLPIPGCDQQRLVGWWHLGVAGEGAIVFSSSAGTVKQVWSVVRIGGPYNSTMTPAFVNDAAFCGAQEWGQGLHPNPGSLTPSWGNKTTLWLAWSSTTSRNVTSGLDQVQSYTVMPANYLNVRNDGGLASGDPKMTIAKRNRTAPTEDPGGFTLAAGDILWMAETIAVQPNLAPPVTPPLVVDWGPAWLMIYVAVITLFFMGAVWIRAWRDS